MWFNQRGDITTLDFSETSRRVHLPTKLSHQLWQTYTWLTKAWTAVDRISVIWKSELADKIKRSFFQTGVVSILPYGCTIWILNKRTEKKLEDNYTIMLRARLNKSWRQWPTKQQLYGHLPPITKTIKIRQTRHAGHCWRSRDGLITNVIL